MVMKGKFEDWIGTKQSGTVVDAKGWIRWNEIPAQVDGQPLNELRVGATIIQDAVATSSTARGGSAWSDETYTRPNDNSQKNWQCDVPEVQNRKFQKGKTPVGGVFVSDNPVWVWAWGDAPTIN
jgi:hypothetical protein